jgi:hypothetical protein
MTTAKEYRELALEFYRWAEEAETDEVRDTYARLADGWTIAALSANCLPPTSCRHTIGAITRH